MQLGAHTQAAFLTELAVQKPPVHADPGFAPWCLKRAIRLNDLARDEEQHGMQVKLVTVFLYCTVRGEEWRQECRASVDK